MDNDIKNTNNKDSKVDEYKINLVNDLNDENIIEEDSEGIEENINNESNVKELDIVDMSEQEHDIENISINKKQIKFKLDKKNKIIIIATIFIILLIGFYMSKTVSKYENKIWPGTFIYNTDISNLNKDEFLTEVHNIENKLKSNELKVFINNKEYSISYENLISKYNNEKLYFDIIENQNNRNKFSKFISIITKKEKSYNLYVNIDENKFSDLKEEISNDINVECTEPKVIIDGEKISYKEGKNGYKLDEDTLYNDIKNDISEKNLIEEDIKVDAKLLIDKPKISINDLKKVNHKISTYTTTYGSGNSRGSNVENAANKIDDLLLMPGDEFSYEKAVGPVIDSNGYKYAPVISNGKLVNGIGGGVCQVSSTLYNTQLKAGILPTERKNHSKPVSYVPRGLDATLASGIIDYKFKNPYDYPLVINTIAKNGNLTIEIWSNKDALKGIEYDPVSYTSGKVSNTYLYGYDKEGNKVYEKHVDTSVYR